MKVRNSQKLCLNLTNLLLDHSCDSQMQVLDLTLGMFQFVSSCMHTLNQLILAPSTSSTPSTLKQSVDFDASAAHGEDNGPSNPEADNTTNATTSVSDPADLDQVRPNESTSWWNYVGWTSTSTSTGSSGARPLNDVTAPSIQTPFTDASQALKPTTPSAANGNTNGDSDVLGLGSAESGLVNDAEEGKSAESTEKAKEEDQGVDQPVPIPSWYSSWGWYSSTNASGPVQLESESGVKAISKDPQIDVPLFLGRPEPTSATSSGTHEGDTPSDSAHPPPINPITTSMEANWGGWASFFSSRSLMDKTLGYGSRGRVRDVKRDDDGMEVMDLDDEEDERRDAGEGAFSKDSRLEDGGT